MMDIIELGVYFAYSTTYTCTKHLNFHKTLTTCRMIFILTRSLLPLKSTVFLDQRSESLRQLLSSIRLYWCTIYVFLL